jgi:hypothetical protein
VPRDQRPFYEYLKRKESFLLGWVGLNESSYTTRFSLAFLSIFFLFLPLTNLSLNLFYYPVLSLIVNLLISLILMLILYTYFFVAWLYVGKRLLSAKVYYEESGWYDGKIWIKPPTILKHERLLYYYQLVPLILRVKKTLKLIVLALIINGISLSLLL